MVTHDKLWFVFLNDCSDFCLQNGQRVRGVEAEGPTSDQLQTNQTNDLGVPLW
jgi:hypothetical protein